ncbi:MAG TPA: succinate dehydrogenase cytochrome b subunit, partial [Candidatus Margulisiibacteriota bacterium]|nr:succinate dehydrogenase cytochrome b subunit [Candidatus Margulisiibacteriota bacterium]
MQSAIVTLATMQPARFHFWSSIGKKLLTGITGVGLMVFLVLHLVGNLNLLIGKDAFNGYTHKLESLGELLVVVELGLLAVFVLHIVSAVSVWVNNRSARAVHNSIVHTKGAPSRQTLASRSMIVTGAVLLVFTVLHVLQFRFGPSVREGYVTTLGNEQVRDLYRLVVEKFKQLPFVIAYMAAMVVVGVHLRHGFWSAFQSLGALNPRLRSLAFSAGV